MNTKNERNAGRKSKFKKGVATFIIADKLPKAAESEIREFLSKIIAPYLNDEEVKSKRNR